MALCVKATAKCRRRAFLVEVDRVRGPASLEPSGAAANPEARRRTRAWVLDEVKRAVLRSGHHIGLVPLTPTAR